MGQLYLELAFVGTGVAAEYIQDQGGTVDDLDAEACFQITLLGGGKLIVKDGHVSPQLVGQIHQLLQLALAQICRSIPVRPLADCSHNLGAGRASQVAQLG